MLLYQYLLHYGMLLHIISQYLCLFSLILEGLHEEGECRQLDSGLEKEQILETYSAQLQKSWNSMELIFGIYKNYWAKETPKGAHTLARRVGGAPTPAGRALLSPGPPDGPPVSIFCYMRAFTLGKIVGKLTGRNSAATRRNLGGTNLGLRRSCSAG